MKLIYLILTAGILLCTQAAQAQDSVFNKQRVAYKKSDDKVHWLMIGDTLFRFFYRNSLIEEVLFQGRLMPLPQAIKYEYDGELINNIQYPVGTISVLRDSGRAREIRFPDNGAIRLRYTKGEVTNIEFNQTYNLPIFRDKKGKLMDPKYDTSTNPQRARLLNQLALYNRLQSLTDINAIITNREYYSSLFSGVVRTGGKVSFPFAELNQSELAYLRKKFPELSSATSGFSSNLPDESKSTTDSTKKINCSPQRVLFALEAGVNIANMQSESGGNKTIGDTKTGVRAGFNLHIPISKSFFLEAGMYYAQKGMVGYYGTPNRNFAEVTLQYAELPVNFAYTFPGFGKGCFHVGLGPYFAMAFAGEGLRYVTGGPAPKEELKFGSDVNQDFSQYDYGGQAIAGYTFRFGLLIRAYYQHGFANIVPVDLADDSGNKTWNRCFGFTLGYQIGRSK